MLVLCTKPQAALSLGWTQMCVDVMWTSDAERTLCQGAALPGTHAAAGTHPAAASRSEKSAGKGGRRGEETESRMEELPSA